MAEMDDNENIYKVWPTTLRKLLSDHLQKPSKPQSKQKQENKTNKPPFLSGPEPTLIRNFLLIW